MCARIFPRFVLTFLPFLLGGFEIDMYCTERLSNPSESEHSCGVDKCP
jgi:hypothetical protein